MRVPIKELINLLRNYYCRYIFEPTNEITISECEFLKQKSRLFFESHKDVFVTLCCLVTFVKSFSTFMT